MFGMFRLVFIDRTIDRVVAFGSRDETGMANAWP